MHFCSVQKDGVHIINEFVGNIYDLIESGEYTTEQAISTLNGLKVLMTLVSDFLQNFNNALLNNAYADAIQNIQDTIDDLNANLEDEIFIPAEDGDVETIENPYGVDSFSSEVSSNYHKAGTFDATPMEAWVLAHTAQNTGAYYSNVQLAWWNTPAGGIGQAMPDNDLSLEAKAFENYIKKASENGNYEYKEYLKDGLKVKGFKLKSPSWLTGKTNSKDNPNESFDNITASYDSNSDTFLIGPFGIDYVKASYKHQDSSIPDTVFAEINTMELVTNIGSIELNSQDNNNWGIVRCDDNGKIISNDLNTFNKEKPNPNTKFYIRLKNDENLTKFKNLNVTFKYMNAAGKYEKLEGTYTTADYTVNRTIVYDENSSTALGCKFSLEVTNNEHKSQTLSLSDYGFIWKETKDLQKNWNINLGKINIRKVVVNSKGNIIDTSTYNPDNNILDFKFNLKVTGAINSDLDENGNAIDTIIGPVTAGNLEKGIDSKTYYWLDSDSTSNPSYELTEIDGSIIEVYRIKDKIVNESLATDKLQKDLENKIHYELEKITNVNGNVITGTFNQSSGETENLLIVNRFNETENNKGYLQIEKYVQNTNNLLAEKESVYKIDNEPFVFKLTITGYEGNAFYYGNEEKSYTKLTIIDTINGNSSENSNYAWNSEAIKWDTNNAPTYRVEEIDVNSLEELDAIIGQNNILVNEKLKNEEFRKQILKSMKASKIDENDIPIKTGVIIPGEEPLKIKFTNNQIIEKAKLHIVKTLNNADKISKETLENLRFKFKISVDGYEENIVTLEKSGVDNVWEKTIEYEWLYGNNPTYKIEEVDVPEGIKFEKIDTKDAIIDNKKVSGTLINDGTNNYEITSTFESKALSNKEATLEISQLISEKFSSEDIEDLKNEIYKYKLYIKGNFAYDKNSDDVINTEDGDLDYGEHSIQLTNNGYLLVDENKNVLNSVENYDINQNYITIDFNNIESKIYNDGSNDKYYLNTVLNIGNIKWYDIDNAPTYEIYEDLTGTNIKYQLLNSSGSLNQRNSEVKINDQVLGNTSNDENKYIVKILSINTTADNLKSGKIFINENLIGQENYEAKFINKEKLKFKLKITRRNKSASCTEETMDIVIDSSLINEKYSWEKELPDIIWNPDKEEAPIYEIEQIEIPESINVKSIKAENADSKIENNKIAGTICESGIKESETDARENTTDLYFENGIGESNEQKGKICISNKVTNKSLNNVQFKFKVTVRGTFTYNNEQYSPNSTDSAHKELILDNITLNADNSWTSDEIKWNTSINPDYIIEEKLEENDVYEETTISYATGYLEDNKTQIATVINARNKNMGYEHGYIKVTKKVTNEESLMFNATDRFLFKVLLSNGEIFTGEIGNEETWTSPRISWNKGENITYEVIETNIPKGYSSNYSISNSRGIVAINENPNSRTLTSVVITNKQEKHSGKFKISTETILSKNDVTNLDELKKVAVKAIISGTFEYEGNRYINTTKILNYELLEGESKLSEEIIWYGNEAPRVIVTEELSTKQKEAGMELENVSNNNTKLVENVVKNIVVTNKISTDLSLIVDFSGYVWEDSQRNGKIDDTSVTEKGVDNVEVYIYDKNNNLVELKDKTDKIIIQPIKSRK